MTSASRWETASSARCTSRARRRRTSSSRSRRPRARGSESVRGCCTCCNHMDRDRAAASPLPAGRSPPASAAPPARPPPPRRWRCLSPPPRTRPWDQQPSESGHGTAPTPRSSSTPHGLRPALSPSPMQHSMQHSHGPAQMLFESQLTASPRTSPHLPAPPNQELLLPWRWASCPPPNQDTAAGGKNCQVFKVLIRRTTCNPGNVTISHGCRPLSQRSRAFYRGHLSD